MNPSFAAKLQPLPDHAIIMLAPLNPIDAKAQVRTTADKDAIKEMANDHTTSRRRLIVAPMVGLNVLSAIVGEADP